MSEEAKERFICFSMDSPDENHWHLLLSVHLSTQGLISLFRIQHITSNYLYKELDSVCAKLVSVDDGCRWVEEEADNRQKKKKKKDE